MYVSFRTEFKQTMLLAGPVVVSMLSQNAMGFIDTVMVGRLGSEALAAVALGNTIYFFLMVVCMGVVLAVGPMVSQAYGAGLREPVERSVRQGLWLGLMLSVPAFFIIRSMGPALVYMGQDPATVARTEGYLHAVSWGYLPMLWFIALRSFVEGISRPWPVTAIAFMGVGLNIAANYVLMFGKLGFPALGLVGTGWATAFVMWFMFGALTLYVNTNTSLRTYRIFTGIRRPDPHYFRELIQIGWPVGVSQGLESGLFMVTALLMGLVGTTALASHQIAIQTASFTFMVPLGVGIAASVRVGQSVGRSDASGARRAGIAGMILSVLFMAGSACVLWLAPEWVVRLYLDPALPQNAEVTALAAGLLSVAAVFQVFDGAQVAAGGALRGLKDTRVPMLIGFVAYWPIGLSVGVYLGFARGMGAAGLWWGLVLGLSTAAVLLIWRFARLTARPLSAYRKEKNAEPAPATSPLV